MGSVEVKHLAGSLVTVELPLAEGSVEESEGQAWALWLAALVGANTWL
jgi:hypothetical protein